MFVRVGSYSYVLFISHGQTWMTGNHIGGHVIFEQCSIIILTVEQV